MAARPVAVESLEGGELGYARDEHMGASLMGEEASEPGVTGMKREGNFQMFCRVTRHLTLEHISNRDRSDYRTGGDLQARTPICRPDPALAGGRRRPRIGVQVGATLQLGDPVLVPPVQRLHKRGLRLGRQALHVGTEWAANTSLAGQAGRPGEMGDQGSGSFRKEPVQQIEPFW
jgi:hypothetical protein